MSPQVCSIDECPMGLILQEACTPRNDDDDPFRAESRGVFHDRSEGFRRVGEVLQNVRQDDRPESTHAQSLYARPAAELRECDRVEPKAPAVPDCVFVDVNPQRSHWKKSEKLARAATEVESGSPGQRERLPEEDATGQSSEE